MDGASVQTLVEALNLAREAGHSMTASILPSGEIVVETVSPRREGTPPGLPPAGAALEAGGHLAPEGPPGAATPEASGPAAEADAGVAFPGLLGALATAIGMAHDLGTLLRALPEGLVLEAVRRLIGKWRPAGYFLPILRHARIAWS